MLGALLGSNPLLLMVGGYLLHDQLSNKNPPAAQPQAQTQQTQQTQQPQVTGPEPGSYVGTRERDPIGPVALDWDIPEDAERGVWKCVADRNIDKARAYGDRLMSAGYPIAATVVAFHVHKLQEAASAQAAIAAVTEMHKTAAAPAPAPLEVQPEAAAPKKRAPQALNGNAKPSRTVESIAEPAAAAV
jgi:hypothetical protein